MSERIDEQIRLEKQADSRKKVPMGCDASASDPHRRGEGKLKDGIARLLSRTMTNQG